MRVLVSMTWRGGGGMGLADDRRGECVEASLVKLKVPVASRAPSREARAQAVAPARARERERETDASACTRRHQASALASVVRPAEVACHHQRR